MRESPSRESCTIVLAGEAGSGIQTIEGILTRAFRRDGFHVFASSEFMSRIRGGSNSTLIRVGSQAVRAWSDPIDLFIPLDAKAGSHVRPRLGGDALVLSDHTRLGADSPGYDLPLSALAAETGEAVHANTIAAGAIWGVCGRDPQLLEAAIKAQFCGKSAELIEGNLKAARKGFQFGSHLQETAGVRVHLPERPVHPGTLFINGSDAVGFGALAGGCNFVSSYPMSPSTGVLTFLAQKARDFGIAVEQAEDEISAANMVLGAWYAGARGLATTSGGGFALMTETISLAGMIESPMVIHLAQRPGPATGLPTRTAQGDLNLALYAGHGEFPRALLAPGNIEQAFDLTRRAFDLADDCQVPVFILTDQHLLDSSYDVGSFDLGDRIVKPAIVQTEADYRRYVLTPDGLSPRGIPGWGSGLVGVDSDEHDEEAHITEDASVRVSMMEKRLQKSSILIERALPPDWIGPADARTIAVCWGSTLEALREAVARLASPDVAVLHFPQVYPLPRVGKELLEKGKRLILVEGNATGQFGLLLTGEWGIRWNRRLLKFDGAPFSVEGLQDALQSILRQEDRS